MNDNNDFNLIKTNWKNADISGFLQYLSLFGKGEEKGSWEQRIVNTKLPCIAVPSKEIDRIAKNIFNGNYLSFLDLWIWENHSTTLIFGKILSKIKDFSVQKKYLLKYSKKADNWSTIDCLKFNFTNENTLKFIEFSNQLLHQKETFSRRLGLIILLKLLNTTDVTDVVFESLNNLKNETEYYVNMAGAWLLAECMTKYREKTISFYRNNDTNNFIINKSISKCRDSFRISDSDKNFLLAFKRQPF